MTPQNNQISDTATQRLYGRSKGAPLRQRPQRLMAELYPQLAVDCTQPVDPDALFGRPLAGLWLEIGFGKGEHLIANALANPDIGHIGCEPFLNGMAACVGQIEDTGVGNVRLYHGNALDVVAQLPDASVARLFILHPDPWPKFRHAKRRVINDDRLAMFVRVMQPGSELRIGTDHPGYLAHALEVMQRQPDFSWLAEAPQDWSVRPADWPETRYEQWALSEGRPVWYLRFLRTDCA
jgi:tRNA (guanine-N7-)-methyltransferase